MGKSTSCFKLITSCGGDAVDKDDHDAYSENKDSNDRRGWSFRKRSARHCVLTETVITESTSSVNKESSEFANINFRPLADTNVVEKISETRCSDEKPKLSFLENSQVSETVITRTESKGDANPPVSVITIQAAIRRFLAQKALIKHRSAVKLQAAFRGHLVRMHAIGTLRCVQAIIKIQVLVRARRARRARLSHSENQLNPRHGKNDGPKSWGDENHTYIEKLLSNRFACQLLESTSKYKPIHVKCDPSKANSAWKWFERWMSVSSKDHPVSKIESSTHESDYIKDIQSDLQPNEEVITNDAGNLNFYASHSLKEDNSEQALPEKAIIPASSEIDSHQNKSMASSDASAPQELNFLLLKTEIDEQSKRFMKKFALDQLETEGKKLVYGSRKASNYAFIAAQSKFEELSSMENSAESQGETFSIGRDTGFRSRESFSFSLENCGSYPSRITGSECGTELSISSTLDTPDRSEVENDETKDLLNENCNPAKKINGYVDDINGKMDFSVVAVDSLEHTVNSETNASDLQRKSVEAVLQESRYSFAASPRSNITFSESHGMPSREVVSVKASNGKNDKSESSNRWSLSASRKNSANQSHDSGYKVMSRKSFSSLKSDHIDQDPRDDTTSGSNSLPHFMQATESARAKINNANNNSPISNPEKHDQDILVKKRHSLPGISAGRHGSPRIQRSITPLHERKWQR